MSIMQTIKVLVTGGHGFLGKAVCEILDKWGYVVFNPPHEELELMDTEAVEHYIVNHSPFDAIIHLAAVCGGIGANQKHPAEFFYKNLMMCVQLLHTAWQCGVKKFVALGTVCCYPVNTPVPFKEEDIWNGYPEPTNAPYGLAKKMMLVQSQAYRAQYGFNSIFVVPTNLYGPGDNCDPESSHVIPALIRKIQTAINENQSTVTLWGTGTATRDFLYVEDAARGICGALTNYDGPLPINLGSGKEISILDLACMISREMGYKGSLVFDKSMPDGQPRRCLSIDRAKKLLDWKPIVSLEDGLRDTIQYWRDVAGK